MISILHREMRIASRRRWTFRIRIIISVLAIFAGVGLTIMGSFQSRMNGNYLFSTLVFFSFWFCLIQGVRKASASISDEKRDGTLGLLFLTDLRPIDIIGGKLFSVAIPLVQPLLAFVPVLSISLLLGGTTGGEVFRAALVLGGILLYSISAGLFVSSISRKGEETGNSTLGLLIASLVIPRIIGAIPKLDEARLLSPWIAYQNISDPGYRVTGYDFWWSWGIMNLLSALLLVGAAFFLQRRWEDKPVVGSKKILSPRKARMSAERRAKLLDRNPGEWLAARHGVGAMETWFFRSVIFILIIFAAVVTTAMGSDRTAGVALLSIATLLVMVRLASQASYPLAEARRCGAIEMLASTPLDPKKLVSGQVAALRSQVGPLLGLILIASVFLIGLNPAMNGGGPVFASFIGVGIFWAVVFLITLTVGSFGMWMGLREKSPNAAFFKTILFTVLTPFLFGCFWFILPIGYIVLLFVSLSRLRGKALERLLRNEGKTREMTPVTPMVAAPPVIRPLS